MFLLDQVVIADVGRHLGAHHPRPHPPVADAKKHWQEAEAYEKDDQHHQSKDQQSAIN
jgi:hypothetical protein